MPLPCVLPLLSTSHKVNRSTSPHTTEATYKPLRSHSPCWSTDSTARPCRTSIDHPLRELPRSQHAAAHKPQPDDDLSGAAAFAATSSPSTARTWPLCQFLNRHTTPCGLLHLLRFSERQTTGSFSLRSSGTLVTLHHVVRFPLPSFNWRALAAALAHDAWIDNGHSVLPPPPRYPSTGPYGAAFGGGVVPMIETNNTVAHPTGPEWQFLVGEGESVYVGLLRRVEYEILTKRERNLRPQRRPAPGHAAAPSFRGARGQSEPARHEPAA